MRIALALVAVVTAGCSVLFDVDDVAPVDPPTGAERPRDAGSEEHEPELEPREEEEKAKAPCPPPIIRKRLGIECR